MGIRVSSSNATSALDRLWLPASRFTIQGGAPTLVGSGGSGAVQGWLLDAASTEHVVTQEFFPEGWTTFDVDIYWLNEGAGTGNVQWRVDILSQAVGSATTSSVTTTSVTQAAGAQDVMTKHTHVTGLAASATPPHRISALRMGADAADTLANDVLFIGIMLRKAS